MGRPVLKDLYAITKNIFLHGEEKRRRILQLKIDYHCSFMAKTAPETPLQILLTTVPLAVMRS